MISTFETLLTTSDLVGKLVTQASEAGFTSNDSDLHYHPDSESDFNSQILAVAEGLQVSTIVDLEKILSANATDYFKALIDEPDRKGPWVGSTEFYILLQLMRISPNKLKYKNHSDWDEGIFNRVKKTASEFEIKPN